MDLPSLAIIALLTLILLVVIVEHSRFMRRYYKLQDENDRFHKDVNREVEKIMQEAVASSEALIDQARIKAQEIVAETKIFSDQMQHKFLEMSEESLRDQVREYETQFAESQKQLTQLFQNTSKVIIEKSDEEVKKFVEKLGSDLLEQSVSLKSKMEEYQQVLYSKVDDSIFAILDDVAQQVIGKSIDYKEHEKLVTKALVEAKHDRFIE